MPFIKETKLKKKKKREIKKKRNLVMYAIKHRQLNKISALNNP